MAMTADQLRSKAEAAATKADSQSIQNSVAADAFAHVADAWTNLYKIQLQLDGSLP